MKISILAVSAFFAALVCSQSLSQLPKCAQGCVGDSLGGCNALDISCICSNKDFITNISCCIANKCSKADQASTIQFANSICKVVGVTLPQAAACSGSGTAANATTGASSGTGTASSSTASSSGSLLSIGSTKSTSTSTSSASPTPPPNTGGLSTGTKVAIGVVIPVVVIFGLIGVFLFFRRRKKTSQAEQDAGPHDDKKAQVELDGVTRVELDGEDVRKDVAELGGEEMGKTRSKLLGSPFAELDSP